MNDPVWQGRTDGAIYECTFQPGVPSPDGLAGTLQWLPAPPTPAAIDPAVLAQQAVDSMNLRAIDIGLAPPPGTMGYVGLPVYLWVDSPTATTWGPTTASATAGSTTVTATASVSHVDWSMGDGTTVNCTAPGTAYHPSYGDAPSPDCGHTYTRTSSEQPDQAYRITATSHWTVTWSGGGRSGTIPLTLTATTTLPVGEIQTLVTSP